MNKQIASSSNIKGLNDDETENSENVVSTNACYRLETNVKLNDTTNFEKWKEDGFDKSTLKKWTTIGIYNYPIRKSGALRTGINNPKAIFTEEQVNEIRKRYVNESGRQIYQDYQSLCSYTTFERVLIGKTYTNLPIYKKKEKKWINN